MYTHPAYLQNSWCPRADRQANRNENHSARGHLVWQKLTRDASETEGKGFTYSCELKSQVIEQLGKAECRTVCPVNKITESPTAKPKDKSKRVHRMDSNRIPRHHSVFLEHCSLDAKFFMEFMIPFSVEGTVGLQIFFKIGYPVQVTAGKRDVKQMLS